VADALQIARLAAVIVLLVAAALVATPRGRLPLALRGIMRTMRRDGTIPGAAPCEVRVAASRKVLAFFLVVLAVGMAVI
jgi:hypothetical protein